MDDKVFESIHDCISGSNKYYEQNELKSAQVKAEKAYSIAINYEKCSEISRKKMEFNLGVIYTQLGEYTLAKSYLDLVQESTIQFKKKQDLGLLYTTIGNRLKDPLKRIECYNSAAINFSKSKDWYKYCQLRVVHAHLLNELGRYKEVSLIAQSIQRACFNMKNESDIAKIYCNLATVYAKDTMNENKVEHAYKYLVAALKINDEIRLELCIHQNLAAVCNQLGEYMVAIEHTRAAYAKLIAGTQGEHFFLSDLTFNEGYAKASLGQFNEAIKAFSQSHTYGLKTNQKNVWESLEEIGTLYIHLSQFDLAHSNYEKCIGYFLKWSSTQGSNINQSIHSRLLAKKSNCRRQGQAQKRVSESNVFIRSEDILKDENEGEEGEEGEEDEVEENISEKSAESIRNNEKSAESIRNNETSAECIRNTKKSAESIRNNLIKENKEEKKQTSNDRNENENDNYMNIAMSKMADDFENGMNDQDKRIVDRSSENKYSKSNESVTGVEKEIEGEKIEEVGENEAELLEKMEGSMKGETPEPERIPSPSPSSDLGHQKKEVPAMTEFNEVIKHEYNILNMQDQLFAHLSQMRSPTAAALESESSSTTTTFSPSNTLLQNQYLDVMNNYDKLTATNTDGLETINEETKNVTDKELATMMDKDGYNSDASLTKEELEMIQNSVQIMKKNRYAPKLLKQDSIDSNVLPKPIYPGSNPPLTDSHFYNDEDYSRDSFRKEPKWKEKKLKNENKPPKDAISKKVDEYDKDRKKLAKSSKICTIS